MRDYLKRAAERPPESDVAAENTVCRISLAPSIELPPQLEVRSG